jgi:flagellar hook-basal body complex protein FliE
MSAPIVPITAANPLTAIESPSLVGQTTKDGGNLFHSMLEKAIGVVESSQNRANQAVEDFLNGNTEDVHSTILATQRADLTFELFTQVRNKVISAYQEIMRMQV